MKWINALDLGIKGRAFKAEGYHRLTKEDNKIMSKVFPPGAHHVVWFPKLGNCSAGLHVDFKTDSRNIFVRWTVKYMDIPDSMSIINQSGMDLYILWGKDYRFVNSTIFHYQKYNECKLVDNFKNIPKKINEFSLNLCSYDEIVELEIGIDDNAKIESCPDKKDYIAFYGSSITQGACASRPGMIYTNIIRRKLKEEVVNLGFCGTGQLNPEMVEILNRLDPKIMVMDCMPNMYWMEEEEFIKRYTHFYTTFRESHPKTPILFVEKAIYTNSWAKGVAIENNCYVLRNLTLKWYITDAHLYYLQGEALYGNDFEASSEGEHPNDIGFTRMADIILKKLKAILKSEMLNNK